jgi:ethanolamine ammonia-lyase small subunit
MNDAPGKNIQWDVLRAHTSARLALGRSGCSLPTRALLEFGLAHAQARDAVHRPLAITDLQQQLMQEGFNALSVASRAPDRHSYLLRPDLGRTLQERDYEFLQIQPQSDLAFVIADGLSSIAVERHALPLLMQLRKLFSANWQAVPMVLANQGRVAIGDEIGSALRSRLVVVLIGERPGLSSPDSLGVYLTFKPQPGRMDSERNCISNVRPEGLNYAAAATKLAFLIRESLRLQLSGIALKDNSDVPLIENNEFSEAALE